MSPPDQIVLFGATGDLARSKLFPALMGIADDCDVRILGIARQRHDDASFRASIAESLPEQQREAFRAWAEKRVAYLCGDVGDEGFYAELARRLDAEGDGGRAGRLFYLSLAPSLFERTLTGLAAEGLLEAPPGETEAWRRVVVEKPFGHDLESARALNCTLRRLVREEQIFRIDHYLGKETVQNLLGLRFHNAIFEPLWNRHHVELVQISVAESEGVPSGRGDYYEQTGALRDVVQSHMLQLLALCAMDAPPSLEPDAVRQQKQCLLESVRSLTPQEVREQCVRGRYVRGEIDDEPVPGFCEEAGVDEASDTETFVALRAEIDSWRWSGVPFLLRHGKRMPRRFTEIQAQFRMPPVQLFERPDGMSDAEYRRGLRDGSLCQTRPNRIALCLQPHEGIRLAFGVKQPGEQMRMSPAQLSFDYQAHFGEAPRDAYERLLIDALRGDPTLFLRGDEIETSWRFIDAIRAGWDTPEAPPLLEYPAGSWGPDASADLFGGCEGGWSHG